MKLTHLNEDGSARMVDTSGKPVALRRAVAAGAIYLQQATLKTIAQGNLPKGDVFAAARIAGIMAAKRCDELIPLCHTIPLDSVTVDLQPGDNPAKVEITAEVICRAQTGAEMEALTAVLGSRPHDLRYGEGNRPDRHDRRYQAAGEIWRQER